MANFAPLLFAPILLLSLLGVQEATDSDEKWCGPDEEAHFDHTRERTCLDPVEYPPECRCKRGLVRDETSAKCVLLSECPAAQLVQPVVEWVGGEEILSVN